MPISNLLNLVYYTIRPAVPRRVQIGLRRMVASAKLRRNSVLWPVYPGSEIAPPGWSGWPQGKKFALVLTHDVETMKGQSRCLDLFRLEKDMNFRSAFNFVAERYPVSAELREFLTSSGFEVGLHGLYHDGKKFRSRKTFNKRAPRMNHYLREWNAVGFRSPSMYCNLDWLHDLNIEYDCSTFDTDPFEPLATGTGAIFPFFVGGRPGARGYIELPYTLPQDLTLFVILKEKNIDIWKHKLDWIAENGGMALMLTHPDYMSFQGDRVNIDEYPAGFYEQFLDYVKAKYEGRYWNPLPKEISRFWRQTQVTGRHASVSPERKPLRVCMPVYSFYDTDNRVLRYAETLARRGDHVDVISLKKGEQPYCERIDGVNVYRIQERIKNEKAKLDYLARLIKFFLKSGWLMTRMHFKDPYDLIHVHSVPDFEVFAAVVPKLTGAKVILDIHDIVPEFYRSKFKTKKKDILFRALLLMEKLSSAFSDHVVISNHLWGKELVSRSVRREKCSVIMNYPDPRLFYKRERVKNDGKIILLYPGSLNWHQGLDIAINAVARLRDRFPSLELHIYGEGELKDALRQLVHELGLNGRVKLHDARPIHQMASIMAQCDIGIVPKRNDSFGSEAFSTKTLDFMALGVPIVISATKIDRYYFGDDIVKFFEPDDVDSLAESIEYMVLNPDKRKAFAENGLRFAGECNWENNKSLYFGIVDRLLGPETEYMAPYVVRS